MPKKPTKPTVGSAAPSPATPAVRVTLDLPLPPKRCHPNFRPAGRTGRMLLWREIKLARLLTALKLREQIGGKTGFPWPFALLETTWYIPRHRDDDGLIAWFKPLRDGLQDAGIVANDAKFRLAAPRQVTERDLPRVQVTITRLDSLEDWEQY